MNIEDAIKDTAVTLHLVNYQISELVKIKENLENKLYGLFNHPADGSKTYISGNHKITITSGWNYTLNKERYEEIGSRLPDCFNPVTTRTAYDLNKTAIKNAEQYATGEELALLSEVISKKPKKIHIKFAVIS